MNAESFSDIFTYVGKAPERTPEEQKRIDLLIKQANIELEEQIKEMEESIKRREAGNSSNKYD
ncbi:hypothetical protein [Methanimicrococcus blatticola]|uniref:Uncharacterized protein n=1 Tax=Methanimicrococcus blatticola TaxID=91560 RepID=A0A484F2E2_9EURY|nr:hypothetical protein [Methanimicrococcus blatticola]MBZ3935427.1 hypothetical protein [Methanimicrococcus blatticola]MCC2508476.1 hypothetical protein [Methanimicrococcus blatticola]TDQ67785.1 hypothetical protein C7391_1336 [Methanimicrococcus blatticola]